MAVNLNGILPLNKLLLTLVIGGSSLPLNRLTQVRLDLLVLVIMVHIGATRHCLHLLLTQWVVYLHF